MTKVSEVVSIITSTQYFGLPAARFNDYVIGVERIETMRADIAVLFNLHWQETEVLYLEEGMDPDWDMFEWMSSNNRLIVFTVRDAMESMVGNAMFVLGHSTHIRGTLQAKEDTFFIIKEHRGGGLASAMLRYIESYMAYIGVKYIGMSDKAPTGGKSLKPLLDKHGYKAIATYYTKQLTKE